MIKFQIEKGDDDRNSINKVKESEKVAFVRNVAYEVTKFGLAFIKRFFNSYLIQI